MTTEIESLTHLPALGPIEFETERTRILDSYIDSLPADRQAKARSFQNDLNLKRLSLSSSDFITYCVSRIHNNVDTISDLNDQAAHLIAEVNATTVTRLDAMSAKLDSIP